MHPVLSLDTLIEALRYVQVEKVIAYPTYKSPTTGDDVALAKFSGVSTKGIEVTQRAFCCFVLLNSVHTHVYVLRLWCWTSAGHACHEQCVTTLLHLLVYDTYEGNILFQRNFTYGC